MLLSSISLSIPTGMNAIQNGVLAVPIICNQLDTGAAGGLSQASICVNYNSSKFSVNADNVYQGTNGQDNASFVTISTAATSGELDIYLVPTTFDIQSVVGTGSGNITVTSPAALPGGLNNYSQVSLSGVSGFAAANGVFNINVTSTLTFTLDGTNGDVGSSTKNTGTYAPVIKGGFPGDEPGATNGSLAVIDFNVLSNAATGTADINLVSSNGLGTTSAEAANGSAYTVNLTSGSANILPESDTTNLGYFSAVTSLTLGGKPGIGTMTLLSNGDVLAQGGMNNASDEWFELAPDGSGNYTDGTWYQVADSNLGILYYGSALLDNGQFMVLGGEDTNEKGVSETNAGEIFTPPSSLPGTGSWTNITPYPEPNFGDDNLEVLGDGNVLAGGNYNSDSFQYDESLDPDVNSALPSSDDPWSEDATLPGNDGNSETTWTKLPDGSILSANLDYYNDASPQTATRLVFGATESADQWVSAGTIPIPLGATGGDGDVQEMGAAFLLPDGDVFQVGANGNTAIYTPPELAGNNTGTWVAGPVIPNGEGATDAPAAMMPNGDVLLAVSPYMNANVGNGFASSSQIDEYDPTTNTISVVPIVNSGGATISSLSNALSSTYCYFEKMLDLPNGQILFTTAGNQTFVYTPNNAPNGTATPLSSWQPVISNAVQSFGIEVTGTQLNGISEGANYGDDAQMASNYPIIRLTSSIGEVTYADSFFWNNTGVQTGSTPVSDFFLMPSGFSPGAYVMNVVANGIFSQGALVIFMGGASSMSLVTDSSNSAYMDVEIAGQPTVSFDPSLAQTAFNQIIVVGEDVNETITINCNVGDRNITINTGDDASSDKDTVDLENTGQSATTVINGGAGMDTIDLGLTNQNLSDLGLVAVYPGSGTTSLYAYDDQYATATTYTVETGIIDRPGWAGSIILGTYQNMSLVTGTAADTVNVISTNTGSTLTLNSGGGDDTVNIGSDDSLSTILGPVNVINAPAFSLIVINNSADAANTSANITTDSITGLGPAPITWVDGDTSGVIINGGSGSNQYYVNSGAEDFTTTINTGSGNDFVEFDENVDGLFNINGQGGSDTLNVIDTNSSTLTYAITSSALTRSELTIDLSNLEYVVLNLGTGLNTVDIESLPCDLAVFGNTLGTDSFNVTDVHLVPNLADGLTIDGSIGGLSTLTIDDSDDTADTNPEILSTEVETPQGDIAYSGLSKIVYDLPQTQNTVYVLSTNSVTDYIFSTTGGNNTLNLGFDSLSGVVSDPLFGEGGITFTGGGGTNFLLLEDFESGVGRKYTFSPESIAVGNTLAVSYTGIQEVELQASNGNNTFAVTGTEQICPLLIYTGTGNDTGTVTGSSIVSPVTINSGGGDDVYTVGNPGDDLQNTLDAAVNINGSSGTDSLTVNSDVVTTNTVTSSSISIGIAGLVNYTDLTSLTVNSDSSGTLNVNSTASGTPVYVDNQSGTVIYNVNSTAGNAPVIVLPSVGNDPVNVSTTGTKAAVMFESTQSIGTLTIANLGGATLSGSALITLTASGVNITGSGALNVMSNTMFINYATGHDPAATIRGYLTSGYAGGKWTGSGINSSTVATEDSSQSKIIYDVGYGDGADGTVSGLSPGKIEIYPTLAGDAKLLGTVNFGDFQILAEYFGKSVGWDEGNFTYGATADFGDFQVLAQNFGLTSALPAAASNPPQIAPGGFVSADSDGSDSILDGSAQFDAGSPFSDIL